MKMIVGVDEVGRGPLAGPVTVSAFCCDRRMGNKILREVFSNKLRDSKKLRAGRREDIYEIFKGMQKEGKILFYVAHTSPEIIDSRGISYAVNRAISKCLSGVAKDSKIRLDGLLKAPNLFKDQKTIIKGDEKDLFIACASIVAKVRRDRLMLRLSKKYPQYEFGVHKGYGTERHRNLIRGLGPSSIHRLSFCKKMLNGVV